MFRDAEEKDISFLNIGLKELDQPEINNYNPVDNYVIYTEYGRELSFANYTISDGIMDLCGIYVKTDKRKKGIGNKMMNYLIDYCYDHKISTIMIEVRPSNTIALNLYKKFGFKLIAVRRDYYQKSNDCPKEDALIMHKKINLRKGKEKYEE